MKKQAKNILAIAGVISTILGIVGAIPSFLKEMYGIAIVSTILIIGGLVLLAIAFGD
ncbi:MAG: hypothetical protein U9R34_07355 [Nanoarchaeota archaeon]|nr:hypothetical protein [Nanoarchaeota archaeon]